MPRQSTTFVLHTFQFHSDLNDQSQSRIKIKWKKFVLSRCYHYDEEQHGRRSLSSVPTTGNCAQIYGSSKFYFGQKLISFKLWAQKLTRAFIITENIRESTELKFINWLIEIQLCEAILIRGLSEKNLCDDRSLMDCKESDLDRRIRTFFFLQWKTIRQSDDDDVISLKA